MTDRIKQWTFRALAIGLIYAMLFVVVPSYPPEFDVPQLVAIVLILAGVILLVRGKV